MPMTWNATDDYEMTKDIIHYSAANESGFLTFGARMYRPAVSRMKQYRMRGLELVVTET